MVTYFLSIQFIIIHHDCLSFARLATLTWVWVLIKCSVMGVNILVPEYILICIITYVVVCILSELWRYLSDDDFCGCLLPSLAWCSITPTFCDSSRLLHDICSCNNQNQRVTESWYWPAGSAAYTYHPKMSMNPSDINDKVFFCSQFLLFLERLWRQSAWEFMKNQGTFTFRVWD